MLDHEKLPPPLAVTSFVAVGLFLSASSPGFLHLLRLHTLWRTKPQTLEGPDTRACHGRFAPDPL